MSDLAEESTEHIRKKPRISRDSFDTMVQIVVGKKKVPFIMHKGLLCNTASYFRAALDGHFKEAQEQVLELPEGDAVIFATFRLWVYTNKLLEEGEAYEDILWGTLTRLYVFGETRGISDLQDAVVDVLIDKRASCKKVPTGQFDYVFQNTPIGSPLRRLVVDWSIAKGNLTPEGWFAEETKCRFPTDFLFDLACAQNAIIDGKRAKVTDFQSKRQSYYVIASDASSGTATCGSK